MLCRGRDINVASNRRASRRLALQRPGGFGQRSTGGGSIKEVCFTLLFTLSLATNLGTKSWELGTRAQAILEFEASPYSVFSDTSLPPPSAIPNDVKESLDDFFDIARDIVTAIEPTSDGNPTSPHNRRRILLTSELTRCAAVDGGRIRCRPCIEWCLCLVGKLDRAR